MKATRRMMSSSPTARSVTRSTSSSRLRRRTSVSHIETCSFSPLLLFISELELTNSQTSPFSPLWVRRLPLTPRRPPAVKKLQMLPFLLFSCLFAVVSFWLSRCFPAGLRLIAPLSQRAAIVFTLALHDKRTRGPCGRWFLEDSEFKRGSSMGTTDICHIFHIDVPCVPLPDSTLGFCL